MAKFQDMETSVELDFRGREINTSGVKFHVGDRITELAHAFPEEVAIHILDQRGDVTTFTWLEIENRANAAAHVYVRHGLKPGSIVGIALQTSIDHIIATIAAWKAGATVVPLDPFAGEVERDHFRGKGESIVVGDWDCADLRSTDLVISGLTQRFEGIGVPRSAMMTGGVTGEPRLILRERPWVFYREELGNARPASSDIPFGRRQLVMLPLYHGGFVPLYQGLAFQHKIILMKHFRVSLFLSAIERYRVQYLRTVPLYMQLVAESCQVGVQDLSSIETVSHASAPCPEWVKRKWIKLIGAEKIIEDYGCTERIGSVSIRGDEWLNNPGSVGRPKECEVVILDDNERPVSPGGIGKIYMRRRNGRQPTFIGGGGALREANGFLSVGDVGYMNEAGYLFLIGRKDEVINCGGADIYPIEIESVLRKHPRIRDVAVVERAHSHLGKVPHALVVAKSDDVPPTPNELRDFVVKQLSPEKLPYSWEYCEEISYGETGKLVRRNL